MYRAIKKFVSYICVQRIMKDEQMNNCRMHKKCKERRRRVGEAMNKGIVIEFLAFFFIKRLRKHRSQHQSVQIKIYDYSAKKNLVTLPIGAGADSTNSPEQKQKIWQQNNFKQI